MKKSLVSTLVLLLALCAAAGELTVDFKFNKSEPFYNVGEKVVITAQVLDDGKPAAGQNVRFQFSCNKKYLKDIRKTDGGKEYVFEHTPEAPGFVSLRVFAVDENGKVITREVKRGNRIIKLHALGGCGVMVAPEKLQVSVAEPADFDEFWSQVKADLAKVPVKEIERKRIENSKADVYDVKIACIGEKPVSGYLCIQKNAKTKSLPAMVFFHGAGVYSSYANVSRAAEGFIYFDVNAHGIENGKPKEFYKDLTANYYLPKGKPGYPQWNKNDRDKFYFKGMFARVIRALEYVKTLPEWDGKHLIVAGGSQGGAQTLIACGMDKDVSLARCEVPAMCDHSGAAAGHLRGWPKLVALKKDGSPADPAVVKASGYYDCVNFAKRVKCPIYFSTGGWDFTCSPTSVYKAYNNVPAGVFKSIEFTPTGNHGGSKTKKFENALKKHIKE